MTRKNPYKTRKNPNGNTYKIRILASFQLVAFSMVLVLFWGLFGGHSCKHSWCNLLKISPASTQTASCADPACRRSVPEPLMAKALKKELKSKQWSCSDLAKASRKLFAVKKEEPEIPIETEDDNLDAQIKALSPCCAL